MRCELAIKCTKPRTILAPSSFNSAVIIVAKRSQYGWQWDEAEWHPFTNVCFAIVSISIDDFAGTCAAAGASQSQSTENHADQAQHQGSGATDYSIAGAGTTCGEGQIQPAVDRGDQPRHQGHDRPHSPVTGAD